MDFKNMTPKDIGVEVRTMRQSRGWSLNDLVSHTGVQYSELARLELGVKSSITEAQLTKVVEVLEGNN